MASLLSSSLSERLNLWERLGPSVGEVWSVRASAPGEDALGGAGFEGTPGLCVLSWIGGGGGWRIAGRRWRCDGFACLETLVGRLTSATPFLALLVSWPVAGPLGLLEDAGDLTAADITYDWSNPLSTFSIPGCLVSDLRQTTIWTSEQKLELKKEHLEMEDKKIVNMTSAWWVIKITYLLTAMDLTCMFMQFGIVPYLATNLGLDAIGFGYLQTFFGILQLLGSPIFGRFADQFGTRAALILSYLAGSLCFLLLSVSFSVPLLFLSRVPGIFMHGLPGAQMVITDLTTPAKRADGLGKLGLCFGIGVIFGSSLGGILTTKFGVGVSCYVAVAGYLACALMALLCIPSQTKPQSKRNEAQQGTSQSSSVFSFQEIIRLLTLPGVMDVFLIKVLSVFPTGVFLIMLSIISIDFFGLEVAHAGYLMSYSGILQMVVQGLIIGRLTSRYTERSLLMLSVIVLCGVGIAMVLMTNVFHYCLIVPPMVFSFSVIGVITDIILTKSVPVSDTGAMLGISASVTPLVRTFGPTIGGFLYRQFGVSSFGYLQLMVNVPLFFYLLKKKIPQKEEKTQ
ncbi:solute carrier family 22 member 18 [Ahaetulla prasina]|uniref:solute carrier family 22 member 18 n=1 Tax=Ahaetulla prasina TaxID=499056 RepID=UPI0026487315|nr:solute carrier family 22 member 18 [Ahaetulla prasina]